MRPKRLSNRQITLISAALVVVIGGLVVLGITSSRDKKAPVAAVVQAGFGSSPDQYATAACQNMLALQTLVARNASKDEVFQYLDTANAEISSAVATDSVYLSLQSGITSLQRAFTQNDAGASELGIAILRDQCRRVGIYLQGAVHANPSLDPSTESPVPTVDTP